MSESEQVLGNTTEFASRTAFQEKYGATALRFYLQSIARELLPNERINVCWRYLLPNTENVEIIYSQERKRARSRGTMKCGSHWVCPVCAAYIGERRRKELSIAIESMRESFFAVMVTYTARHNQSTRLREQLAKMAEAYRFLRSGRTWQDIKTEWFIAGSVRATEMTYGDSGWHPHYHEIVFARVGDLATYYAGDPKRYAETLQNQLRVRWAESLEKHGLSAELTIGVTVRSTNKDVAEYVAKFGKMPRGASDDKLTHEMTLSHNKRGRDGNLSVYDILFNAGNGDDTSKRLFVEYHDATKGRSQLQWSKGLKRLMGIEEIRDEIAAEGIETESDVILATLSREQWRLLSQSGLVPQLMTIAHRGDGEKMKNFLDSAFQCVEFTTIDLSTFMEKYDQ